MAMTTDRLFSRLSISLAVAARGRKGAFAGVATQDDVQTLRDR
jgi:hypothetical protein